MSLRLYPPVRVVGQDFSKEKIQTVPSQTMSLREILTRYVRRQALPVTTQAMMYEDRMGDLEKMATEDITVQLERAGRIKTGLKDAEKRQKDKEKPVESPASGVPPSGVVTGAPVAGQAPPASPPA